MASLSYVALIMLWTATRSIQGTLDDFFPEAKQNLTKISWAHAVNNQTYLNETLATGINMIEADIVLGTLPNDTKVVPIMAHPPLNSSDLSLESFLAQVRSFDNSSSDSKKGIKLDFKTIEVFEASTDIVANVDKGEFPIWINADILPGPINSTTTPVNASRFLAVAKSFSNSVLSIGWTTEYGSNSSGSYEATQIQSMIDIIQANDITQEITFPVRAGLAAQSVDVLAKLTQQIENSTLTIWSSEGDNVDVDALRDLIVAIGLNRTYIDVPSDLLEKLHLDDLPSKGSPSRSIAGAVFWIPLLLVLAGVFQSLI